MAEVCGGVGSSHVPAVGVAIDKGRGGEPYWAPFFEQRAREAELDYITSSEFAEASLCEQYAGMPFEPALEIVAR